ncbi:DNA damage-repair/toleration protein DRT100 [Amborella trichopoda]|uniref:DNA damage-repair/toleration protein DRT100 n=1 Tax=Amborella trichopoda TaxID=13333 RepID=UPI0005D461C3|nr:DNA damage-repair/toleration protein DRT100 [Amborella trichopoda]|eukprot:XP_011622037.1 DNA damage-repair/toleration protein DRT100 [Amborella trichopoda]
MASSFSSICATPGFYGVTCCDLDCFKRDSIDAMANPLANLVSSVFAELSKLKKLQQLNLGSNFFSGMLPVEIDLSNNNISGNLPHNLTLVYKLEQLNLSNNSLDRPLLSANFDLPSIQSIHLEHNAFHGTILENLLLYSPFLMVIDIGAIYMSGRIPREIAETSNLQQLAILDLSENNFEGSIPSCFHKSSAWVNGSRSTIRASTDAHVNFYKRNEYGYSGIVLSVVTGIDLSLNHLSGPIPMEIGILKGLIVLNISNNHLNGTIPDSFAKLSQIEVLDLSHNMLKGRIPSDLGSLTFLSQFSVAFNDLEGAVPIVNNFQTFEESSYCGNPKLCGYLGKECSKNPKLCGYPRKKCSQLQQEDKENEEKISRWVGDKPVLYACIAMEFVVGFWGVLWFLFLIKKWRFVWFKAMDGPIHRVFSGREWFPYAFLL